MFRDLKWAATGAVLALGMVACQDRGKSDVERQQKQLSEAQSRAPQVAKDTEAQLAKAKAEVARLEQKLALARQGITDDVLNKRKELQQALEEQQHRVQGDVDQAKREAAQHNEDTMKATQALQATKPPRVQTKVNTETRVTPAPTTPPQTTEREEVIRVRGQAVDAGAGDEGAP
jgi:hypothetical protein